MCVRTLADADAAMDGGGESGVSSLDGVTIGIDWGDHLAITLMCMNGREGVVPASCS